MGGFENGSLIAHGVVRPHPVPLLPPSPRASARQGSLGRFELDWQAALPYQSFWILEMWRFVGEFADFEFDDAFVMAVIVSVYGAIMNFTGFFWSDPVPTRKKCK